MRLSARIFLLLAALGPAPAAAQGHLDRICSASLDEARMSHDRVSLFVDDSFNRDPSGAGLSLDLDGRLFSASWLIDARGRIGTPVRFRSNFTLPAATVFPVRLSIFADDQLRWSEIARDLPRMHHQGYGYPPGGAMLPERGISLAEVGDVSGVKTLFFRALDAAGVRTGKIVTIGDWRAIRRQAGAALRRVEAARKAHECAPSVITEHW